MATAQNPPTIPPDLLAEMQERAYRAAKGIREPDDMRRAFERTDRMRETMPETNLAVELVREARNQE